MFIVKLDVCVRVEFWNFCKIIWLEKSMKLFLDLFILVCVGGFFGIIVGVIVILIVIVFYS